MQFADIELERLPGEAPAWRGSAPVDRLRDLCGIARAGGGRLAALWGAAQDAELVLWLVLDMQETLIWLDMPLDRRAPRHADVSDIYPTAGRMQRALHDLLGIAHDGLDQRPWLRHDAWPHDVYTPRTTTMPFVAGTVPAPYPFAPVVGEGVHEIPLGPVRGGIAEPRHVRLSALGDTLQRAESRLGYTHRGIDRRFESLDAFDAARLAGRISGDSTVAYAWAYAMALEAIATTPPTARALYLRAILLERERIANHLGDLGALGNAGGFVFGFAQFMRLKEEMLRLNDELFGHRYAMDVVVPGGVTRTIGRHGADSLLAQCDALEREVNVLRRVYDGHAGLQDRFVDAGRLPSAHAAHLGAVGPTARASGATRDLRTQPDHAPYDNLDVAVQTASGGDVAARVQVRFAELQESLRLLRLLVAQLPLGDIQVPLDLPTGRHRATGRAEGWRGEVLVLLETDGARVRHCHALDPSWHNLLALEHAMAGCIVPDVPLIECSFNLSCAGYDR